MKREDAADLTMDSAEKKHFLQETWHCGLINQQIGKAAKEGRYETRMRFSARSFPARHQQRFISLYEAQGYTVRFVPNYVQIKPTQWTMIISWKRQEQEEGRHNP